MLAREKVQSYVCSFNKESIFCRSIPAEFPLCVNAKPVADGHKTKLRQVQKEIRDFSLSETCVYAHACACVCVVRASYSLGLGTGLGAVPGTASRGNQRESHAAEPHIVLHFMTIWGHSCPASLILYNSPGSISSLCPSDVCFLFNFVIGDLDNSVHTWREVRKPTLTGPETPASPRNCANCELPLGRVRSCQVSHPSQTEKRKIRGLQCTMIVPGQSVWSQTGVKKRSLFSEEKFDSGLTHFLHGFLLFPSVSC